METRKDFIELNKEIAFQNKEKGKRAAELVLANKEVRFQKKEKGKRAAEYAVLNEELTDSINQIRKINIELKFAKEKAEESDMLKSMFLANMSHEIRTPMNSIMGFSDLLLEQGLPDEKKESYVQIIHSSSLQLLSVISDILDISKIEAGQINLSSDLIDVNKLINELFQTYVKTVKHKNNRFICSCQKPKETIQTISDGNRIKQVLCNLLDNSIKFTNDGEIEIGYKMKGDFIEFFVKDSGIGILPENHELIFQRFRQVDATDNRRIGGNGLGLSISKALVHKLGGSMQLKSSIGEGSEFSFTIPIVDKRNSILYEQSENSPLNYLNGEGKTILIAEDETNSYAYIEEILSASKVNIIHAWNGSEAVEFVKNNSDITLVLMDIKMQEMDGYEALRNIKKIRPNLPVIAQTAYALNLDRTQSMQVGFDNYISKPIAKNALIDLITGYFK